MSTREFKTVQEVVYWAYANLAMAHTAVEKNQRQYLTFNYMIRAKLYKGLMSGTMNIRSIFDDEKIKLMSGSKCSYCGSKENLALDHIFAKSQGGQDVGDNLIYACRSCNSSKGGKDMMEWMSDQNSFPPLMILRRYLKLVITYCMEHNLMEYQVNTIQNQSHPFKIEYIPMVFPKPSELILMV